MADGATESDTVKRLEEAWRANAYGSEVPTQALEGDLHLIRRLLREDAEFFVEFFLAESLDMPVPQFHKEIWGLLTDQEKERVLLAIPRDHAKTTLAKLVVIWYWLFTPHRFAVYLSNTAPIAKGACRDIMSFLLESTNFHQVYGKIRIEKQSENEGLWIFHLPLGEGRTKRCILRGLGQGQQMRGINIDNQRPDIAVVDDVEDNENTESPAQQLKLDKWMFGPFLKALARRKKILWLGNMLAKTSLLARLSRNPRWNPVVFGCLVRDNQTGVLSPLWPGKWTVEALQDDFKEYRDGGLIETWMCEMMNMPGHGENGFTSDQLKYQVCPTPDRVTAAWITIDPAFGKSAHNDESAIALNVIPVGDMVPMTVLCEHGHFSETEIFERALNLAETWGAWTWGIEAVAAQKVLITLFSVMATLRTLTGRLEFVPLTAGTSDPKVARIRAWASMMASGEWAIADNDIDITNQFLNYDVTKKDQRDDIIDACAYGPAMLNEYAHLIQMQFDNKGGIGSVPVQSGVEVTG